MMRAWLDTLQAFSTTVRNLSRPRVTEALPWKGEREHPERYRGTLALVHDEHGEPACIACKACEKMCPSQIITVVAGERKPHPVTGKKRGYAEDFSLDLNACIFCEMCVQVCPADAIVMVRDYHRAGYAREDQLLTMDRLYENGESGKLAWATGSRLRDMQNPKREPQGEQLKAAAGEEG